MLNMFLIGIGIGLALVGFVGIICVGMAAGGGMGR